MEHIDKMLDLRGSLLYKKVYGSLIGGVIGDAFGGPMECMHYKFIRKLYNGRVTTLVPYNRPDDFFQPGHLAYALSSEAGSYTDDTRLQLLITKAIVEKQGRINADDLADMWMRHMDVRAFWHSISAGFHRIAMSAIPVREAGVGNISENSAPTCIGPVGIINAGNPAQAAMDAYDLISLSHNGHAREAACAIASAVAEAMRPDATVLGVIEAVLRHLPNRDTSPLIRRIETAIRLADDAEDTEELTGLYYDRMNVKWVKRSKQAYGADRDDDRFSASADPLESVPCVLGMFYKCGGVYTDTIIATANYGRDCDTMACMAGYIAGAFEGADKIPCQWVNIVNSANHEADFEQLADGLCSALIAEQKRMQIMAEMINSMAATRV
ncbi:MAG: ADP-ribosylglycohydrolase family protein [Firmicutes bacterium]|nr:ADP-ribosylglycohydrolase family protein [Bacillota bacterium]